MIAGIITTPKRQQYLMDLIKVIAPQVDKLIIYNDEEKRGHTWNYKRCVKETTALAKPNEPVLIMTDDVITVPDWRKRFEDLQKEIPNEIYTFFTRQKNLLKHSDKGFYKACIPRGFYDQAIVYINQQDLMDNVDEWFIKKGQFIIPEKRAKHFDVVIQSYLIDIGQEWVVTVPTLFDHIGAVSTLGHNIGGSIAYIGDND
jgi:hypothetical protein